VLKRPATDRVNIRPLPSSLLLFTLLIALLAGALNVLAFAPFNFWPLQIISLALLFGLVVRAPERAFLLGWAYGFGCFVFGVYWLYLTMHRFGHLAAPLAALAIILFALLLGVFGAVAMSAGMRLARRWQATPAVTLLLLFPATWMLLEWVRGWIFTGFPWLAAGYAHTGDPLAGFAPIVGVYGVGWLAALIAGTIALAPIKKMPLALAFVVLMVGFGLESVAWTAPSGQPISVRLLQGNVPQNEKFERAQLGSWLMMYEAMLLESPADLIVTPETAIPLLMQQLPPDYIEGLTDFARRTQSHLALGIFSMPAPQQYMNSVIELSPQSAAGAPLYTYGKHHLVPYGEFIPFGFRWFTDMMQIPLGDQAGGAELQAPFAVKDQWVLPNICYENLFGEEIARQLAARYFADLPQPTILLNLSNLAWYDEWLAIPQHLQISQMRALETGRPMLSATNTGATAIINPRGQVVTQLEPYTRGVLAATVQGFHGITPYVRFGNALILALVVLLLGAAWLLCRKNRKPPHEPA
jgi:apolipoprotein N-acyltransferase